jgi:glutamate synthase domain-containing protein 2/glutamate synthase domain-containing protein 1/glutamate synthase domain-containing protein 3
MEQPFYQKAKMASLGMYSPNHEHENCGLGFLININGEKTHSIISDGVSVLKKLLHRGATGADDKTGDGAGLQFQLPHRFFERLAAEKGWVLPEPGFYGAGMVFLPAEPECRDRCCKAIERSLHEASLDLIGWRDLPVNSECLGQASRYNMPFIRQCLVNGRGLAENELERKLFVARKHAEKEISSTIGEAAAGFYVTSLSCRTIVYKGLLMPRQVEAFYPDLRDELVESAFVIVHQRYSTNTFPSWSLAQPFRYLCHNGEINTLRGNRNWMASRERDLESELFGSDLEKIIPVLEEGVSDSANLDNALELIHNGGRSIEHSMAMLIPQAWGDKYPIGPDLRGFFEYHAGIMEPWDGPAVVVYTDGHRVGAILDRNGLRPARYTVTKNGFMVFASEAGVMDLPPAEVCEKGALRPGEMLLVDLKEQRLFKNTELKMRLARRRPYRRWTAENQITIHGFFNAMAPLKVNSADLLARQKLFGYTREDINLILKPMALEKAEPVGSMGADQPLAVLSEKPQLLFWYFKQCFAQVTNPAIDPHREELVMSLMTFIGCPDNLLSESPRHAHLIKLSHPILSNEDLERLCSLEEKGFRSMRLKMQFSASGDGTNLLKALDQLCNAAEEAVRAGFGLIVLTDRELDQAMMPIPSLLAVSAVNRHLTGKRLRTGIGILVESAETREVMHMALLLGYGASAINPYLAFESIAHLAESSLLGKKLSTQKAMENYVLALCKGILKVMSKIGISTLRSYRNGQVFEAVGLNDELINRYFEGTASRIQGLGLNEIAREVNLRYEEYRNFEETDDRARLLPSGGQYVYRVDGERHLWTPQSISLLQHAVRANNFEQYLQYAAQINDQSEKQSTLRGLLAYRKTAPIALNKVEPASEIVKRFVTGAMSFGSISPETHETLAEAMNSLGGKSNSGEGGEDPERYRLSEDGRNLCSAVKQVASGRFGVTAEYLANADEIQIKIAQGAKPGEGGQLPGHKVDRMIARVRHSTPGVTLISPPPHHDIYSIEDLAQLIYDLRNANPNCRISVKLVSEVGVGTVAAGVAKARADMILISGYDGGTGAAPLSSIKHTGVPWELGLAEAQHTLILNGLRSRVRLQVDGGLKTGRDVAIGAMLGAEEFGFATAALIVCGCVMMRDCHSNCCPVGVATQDDQLRKFFSGKPEYVRNFMLFVAEELRLIMAGLGIASVDELVGRSDLLEQNRAIAFWKARQVDLSRILHRPALKEGQYRCSTAQPPQLEEALDYRLLPLLKKAIENGEPVVIDSPIYNCNRTVGTLISYHMASKYGNAGLPDNTITLNFKGSAGQSFGAFAAHGLTLKLEGEANDYIGKGLSGGRIILKPFRESTYDPSQNTIGGNVCLYGATAGEFYACGMVGERFAIRNSGALAVVEGIGDHGCEYMTGGRVVVLGQTGVNFGAGMSGGIAYIYDRAGKLDSNSNLDMIDLETITEEEDILELQALLKKHRHYTGSRLAGYILENWDDCLPFFIKVFPMEYRLSLGKMSREDQAVERTRPQVN